MKIMMQLLMGLRMPAGNALKLAEILTGKADEKKKPTRKLR